MENFARNRGVIGFLVLLASCSRENIFDGVYQYYEKIPVIRGVTNDEKGENKSFILQVNLGYKVGDKQTLKNLSLYQIKIAAEMRQMLASRTSAYLQNKANQDEIEAGLLRLVNRIISPDPQDEHKVREIQIIELFLYDYR